MLEKRRTVTNTSDRLMLLFIEPEAWDCWLMPGESIELRAVVESSADDFELRDNSDGVTAWPSWDMGIISVHQAGQELQCGHQRSDGWL